MADAKVKKEKQYRDAKFPEGLKTINAKEAAHYGSQTYVKDVYIPASVDKITKDAFTVLRGMTGSFIVDPENAEYSAAGRALLSKDGKRFLHFVISKNEDINVAVVPEGVEEIEEYSFSWFGNDYAGWDFYHCSMIMVVIPPSVKHIADHFFLALDPSHSTNERDFIEFGPSVAITGVPGTIAESFAVKRGFYFCPITDWNSHPDTWEECIFLQMKAGRNGDDAGYQFITNKGNACYYIVNQKKDVSIAAGARIMSNACVGFPTSLYRTGRIRNLYIPKTVDKIESHVCFSIITGDIIIDDENPYYKAEDNIILSKDGERLIFAQVYSGKTIGIPDSVKQIEPGSLLLLQSEISDVKIYVPDALRDTDTAFFAYNGEQDALIEIRSENDELLKTIRIGAFYDPYECIEFGRFSSEWEKNVPIEWYIVDKKEDQMLLVSKYALSAQSIVDYSPLEQNNKQVNITWASCALRQELNGAFLTNCFSEDERTQILETELSVNKGETTQDKVFLLGQQEVIDFFKDTQLRYPHICLPSKTAKQQFKANHEPTGKWVLFWARDMDFDARRGQVLGVRPAIWVKI